MVFARPLGLVSALMMRSALMRRIGVAMALVAAALVLASSVVGSLSLANSQAAERDLGEFEFGAQLPVALTPGSAIPRVDMTATASAVLVSSGDLRVTEQPQTRAAFIETNWQANPLPLRYQLVSGRWPRSAGEVATSAPVGASVHVLGDVAVQVVGEVVDRYDRHGFTIAAAPGTWSSWHVADLSTRFPNTLATATYLWIGDRDAGLDALALVAAKHGMSAASARGQMSGLLLERDQYLATDKATAAKRFPLVLGLPVAIVPLLAGVICGGLAARWSRRVAKQLQQIGVPDRLTVSARMLATLAATSAGVLTGCVVAAGAGLAVRPALDAAANQPLAPFAIGWGDMILVLAGSLVGTSIGMLSSGLVKVAKAVRFGARPRRVAAGIAALSLVSQFPGPDDGIAMTVTYSLFAMTVALLSPDVLTLLIESTKRRGMATQLGAAMLNPRQGFVAALLAPLTLVISLSGGAIAITAGSLAAANAQLTASIPPGFAVLRTLDASKPVPSSIRSRFEEVTGLSNPVVSWGAGIEDLPRGFDGEPRLFSSLADIERWLGHPLTTQQATALESGALGLFAPAEGKVAISPVEGRWVDLEPVQIDAPKEWAANYGGILLEPAVSRLRLKKVNEEIIYSSVSADQQISVADAAARLGIEPGYIVFNKLPVPYSLPDSFRWALAALCVVAAGLMVILVTGQARAMRPQLGALKAIGVPQSWIAQVLGFQVALVCLTSGVLAGGVVVGGNLILWAATPDALVPRPDPLSLVVVAAVTVVGALAGMGSGLMTLRSSERSVF